MLSKRSVTNRLKQQGYVVKALCPFYSNWSTAKNNERRSMKKKNKKWKTLEICFVKLKILIQKKIV